MANLLSHRRYPRLNYSSTCKAVSESILVAGTEYNKVDIARLSILKWGYDMWLFCRSR